MIITTQTDQEPVLIQTKRRQLAWTRCKEMTTALPNKLYSGHHRATEEEGDQGILGDETWSQKWKQQGSSTAGARRRRRWLEDGTGWRKVVCGLCCTWSDKAKSQVSQVRRTASTLQAEPEAPAVAGWMRKVVAGSR